MANVKYTAFVGSKGVSSAMTRRQRMAIDPVLPPGDAARAAAHPQVRVVDHVCGARGIGRSRFDRMILCPSV